MSDIEHTISIKVNNTKYFGCDADITIAFYDEEVWTKEITIKDALKQHEKGTRSFKVKMRPLQNVALMRLSSTGGFCTQWHVDKIEIESQNANRKSIFQINKWIKQLKTYTINEVIYATCLPQNDPDRTLRAKEVEEQAQHYEYAQQIPGGPVQVQKVPSDEWFTCDYSIFFFGRGLKDNCKASDIDKKERKEAKKGKRAAHWQSFKDFNDLYEPQGFPKPKSADLWLTDARLQDDYFGQLRLTGANHSVIKLCTSVPEKMFGKGSTIKPQDLKKLLEGNTVESTIQEKRLFIVDLEILHGIQHTKEGFKVCAPVALFYVNKNKRLVPVAIQLYQQPSANNPVFLPSDNKYVWMMAKMWFNNADAAYHQSIAHLGFTHLIVEGFIITTHRNLSDRHPLYKLLLPHFLFLIQINSLALKFLIDSNGFVEETMNIGAKGMKELIVKRLKTWKLGVEGNLPEELKSRGVLEDVLPHYYYRDDALSLWNIILKYVTSYVSLYYGAEDSPKSLKDDYEVQNWAHAIVTPRPHGQGILDVPGVPENGAGRLTDKSALCNILTSIIFTSSVVHASVNFMQYDQYSFPPSYPSYLTGTPPTSKKSIEEGAILQALPDFDMSAKIMNITQTLSGFGTHKLGDFPTPYITDPKALPIVKTFRDDLNSLSNEITHRNAEVRKPEYNHLNPANIPNAISI